jgi:hypothetical protein
LLAVGAYVHAYGDEALRLASNNRHIGVVIKLVEAGADLKVLGEYWVNLFDCQAPASLVKMDIRELVELMVAEAIRKELA